MGDYVPPTVSLSKQPSHENCSVQIWLPTPPPIILDFGLASAVFKVLFYPRLYPFPKRESQYHDILFREGVQESWEWNALQTFDCLRTFPAAKQSLMFLLHCCELISNSQPSWKEEFISMKRDVWNSPSQFHCKKTLRVYEEATFFSKSWFSFFNDIVSLNYNFSINMFIFYSYSLCLDLPLKTLLKYKSHPTLKGSVQSNVSVLWNTEITGGSLVLPGNASATCIINELLSENNPLWRNMLTQLCPGFMQVWVWLMGFIQYSCVSLSPIKKWFAQNNLAKNSKELILGLRLTPF